MPADDLATIEPLSDHPFALPIAAQWIWETWGTKTLDHTIELLDQPKDCPPTLIALIYKRPVGVLGFGRWRRPDETADSLWINSLYVIEDERSRRLGSRLVAAAVESASSFADELNVLTDIPSWYERRGWTRIEESSDGSVLQRPLTQIATCRP
jgi:GNAT superfamily N-acetyltransferase